MALHHVTRVRVSMTDVLHADPTADPELPDGKVRRVRLILAALVLPLLAATIIGLLALWPRGETPMGSMPLSAPGTGSERGTVVEAPGGEGTGELRVELNSGEQAGAVVPVQAPGDAVAESIDPGDRVRLLFVPQALETGSPYVFWDFERTVPVAWLTALYLGVVALVARWKGLAAVVGLLGSLAVVAFFDLPAIMLGSSPVLVALVGSSAMMFLAVYLAHGVSIRTTTALLGTFVGLAVTVLLALWGTGAANLSGASEGGQMVQGLLPALSLRELLLCGMVIAGLGALNDVTITQASAVWELYAANARSSRRKLFTQGMRIGRDHIASTVYTLAFAYVGTALPLLMGASLVQRPLVDTLMSGEIAEEIVRTLVSSIGLVLAIPVTTGIAAALAKTGPAAPASPSAEPAGEGVQPQPSADAAART